MGVLEGGWACMWRRGDRGQGEGGGGGGRREGLAFMTECDCDCTSFFPMTSASTAPQILKQPRALLS